MSEPVLQVLRRELKRISPDVRVEIEEIQKVLADEVIKREVVEGDQAKEALKKIARAASKALRTKKAKEDDDSANDAIETTEVDLAITRPESTDAGETN